MVINDITTTNYTNLTLKYYTETADVLSEIDRKPFQLVKSTQVKTDVNNGHHPSAH